MKKILTVLFLVLGSFSPLLAQSKQSKISMPTAQSDEAVTETIHSQYQTLFTDVVLWSVELLSQNEPADKKQFLASVDRQIASLKTKFDVFDEYTADIACEHFAQGRFNGKDFGVMILNEEMKECVEFFKATLKSMDLFQQFTKKYESNSVSWEQLKKIVVNSHKQPVLTSKGSKIQYTSFVVGKNAHRKNALTRREYYGSIDSYFNGLFSREVKKNPGKVLACIGEIQGKINLKAQDFKGYMAQLETLKKFLGFDPVFVEDKCKLDLLTLMCADGTQLLNMAQQLIKTQKWQIFDRLSQGHGRISAKAVATKMMTPETLSVFRQEIESFFAQINKEIEAEEKERLSKPKISVEAEKPKIAVSQVEITLPSEKKKKKKKKKPATANAISVPAVIEKKEKQEAALTQPQVIPQSVQALESKSEQPDVSLDDLAKKFKKLSFKKKMTASERLAKLLDIRQSVDKINGKKVGASQGEWLQDLDKKITNLQKALEKTEQEEKKEAQAAKDAQVAQDTQAAKEAQVAAKVQNNAQQPAMVVSPIAPATTVLLKSIQPVDPETVRRLDELNTLLEQANNVRSDVGKIERLGQLISAFERFAKVDPELRKLFAINDVKAAFERTQRAIQQSQDKKAAQKNTAIVQVPQKILPRPKNLNLGESPVVPSSLTQDKKAAQENTAIIEAPKTILQRPKDLKPGESPIVALQKKDSVPVVYLEQYPSIDEALLTPDEIQLLHQKSPVVSENLFLDYLSVLRKTLPSIALSMARMNHPESYHRLRLMAQFGLSPAKQQEVLGDLYRQGIMNPMRDNNTALIHYFEAAPYSPQARPKAARALFEIASEFFDQDSTNIHMLKEAIFLYNHAMLWGNVESIHNLAIIHTLMADRPEYADKAVEMRNFSSALFMQSAASGFVPSMYVLGQYYRDGSSIFEKDLALAHYWFKSAADRGYRKAQKELEALPPLLAPKALDSCHNQKPDPQEKRSFFALLPLTHRDGSLFLEGVVMQPAMGPLLPQGYFTRLPAAKQ